MGMYDTFGEAFVQLKVGECLLTHYKVGDVVDLQNGIYCGYDRAIVINGGLFVADMPLSQIYDKWGSQITLDINRRNPISKAVEELKKELGDENIADGNDEGTSKSA